MKNYILNFIELTIVKYFALPLILFCNLLYSQKTENVSISMNDLNALYIGVENFLTIAIPGVSSGNLTVKISPGSIEGKDGKYIAKVYKRGSATIEVFNQGELIETVEFKSLFIPSPVPYLGNLTGDTNSKREDLISAECISAEIPNFLLNLKFKVTSFSMQVSLIKQDRSVTNVKMLNPHDGCLTEEMKAYILNPNIESAIHFDDIKVQCPDGAIRRINNRITIRLTDELLNKLDLEQQKVILQNAEILFKEQRILAQKNEMKQQASVLKKQNRLILKRKNEIIAHEKEILFQKNVLNAQVIKIKNQNTFLSISIIVILGVVFLMVFSIRSNRMVKNANLKLAEQNIIIARKNHEITDSINYAERIQRSILPPLVEVETALPESFILFKPKDIVSGDFYWFFESVDKILIAVADCTGHGVPGAFMSAIGSEKLNEAVMRSDDVSAILQSVNIGMKKVLHQSGDGNSTNDGMDIAICAFDKDMTKLVYAGANRPIWVLRNGNNIIEETKATKAAIGGYTIDEQEFVKHEINLQKNDTVYLFSDGFADQFGIGNNKKLKTKSFKKEILVNQLKSMEDQKWHLDSFIENWKGTLEQTDDILVVGIRV
ncbi:MAG: GldM family protein [Bacteroidia bacterium]|nr:GldM family protein [Bacteroidia bacterium]